MGRDCFLCGLCQGYITPVTNITVRNSRQEPDTGSSRREPDTGSSRQEPDTDSSRQETDTGSSRQEPDTESSQQEPDTGSSHVKKSCSLFKSLAYISVKK
jgi:hypothetical protein